MKRDFWIIWAILCACYLACVFGVSKCAAQAVPLVRVKHDCFTSYYDIERHNPALVVYYLEASHFAGNLTMKGRHFKADTQLPRPRVMDKHYSNTGYVRGHLMSAGDRDSNKAWLKESYLTSNLVPMTMVCNSGPWKVIEDSCRALASAGHRLLICRGPMYDAGTNVLQYVIHLEIPDAFFCLLQCVDCGYRGAMFARNTNSLGENSSAAGVLQGERNTDALGLKSVCYKIDSSSERVGSQRGTIQSRPGVPRGTYQVSNTVIALLTNILGLWSREVFETTTP